MNQNLSLYSKIGVGMLLAWSLINIIIAYLFLTAPVTDHSEFNALKTTFDSFISVAIIIFSLASIISEAKMLRQKRRAFYTGIVLVALTILLLETREFWELAVNISESKKLSFTKEVAPILALLLLLLGKFWKKDFAKTQPALVK